VGTLWRRHAPTPAQSSLIEDGETVWNEGQETILNHLCDLVDSPEKAGGGGSIPSLATKISCLLSYSYGSIWGFSEISQFKTPTYLI
jgi:hypothetical protein